jgi:hypothetical protein
MCVPINECDLKIADRNDFQEHSRVVIHLQVFDIETYSSCWFVSVYFCSSSRRFVVMNLVCAAADADADAGDDD